MKRTVIRTNGATETIDVGEGFESWNRVIGARTGEIVCTITGQELWCDEEGLLQNEPEANLAASALAGRVIVGDVIVFERGDIK